MKAAILGTTGYTGMILLRLLSRHDKVEAIIPASSSQAGTSLLEIDHGLGGSILDKTAACGGKLVSVEEAVRMKPDVVFAALPHLTSAKVCEPFFGTSVLIDLSADFRFRDEAVFERVYKEAHPRPDLLKKAVYGLAEIYPEEIAKADLIANPGCYPTATLLPLLPLIRAGVVRGTVVVNALSGISGAGRSAKINNLFCERAENTNAYAPGRTHRHQAEIQQILDRAGSESAGGGAQAAGGGQGGGLETFFTPHLVPLKQGMAVTTFVQTTRVLSDEEIDKIYNESYGKCPFVKLTGSTIPETRDVRNSNRCDIGRHRDGDKLILFSVVDNLLKGASGQAVQNMNIRFGFPETAGLSLHGEI
jgi:N-acetyl-gamma-glutamyl-phosphate reductase